MTSNLTKKRIFSEGDVTFYRTSSGIVCEIQKDDPYSRTIAACARRFAGSAAPLYGGWTTVLGERKTDESDKDYSN